jgi:hypothetical protein
MSDELKERNILKLILIVRFACATLDVGHPIYMKPAIFYHSILIPEWTDIFVNFGAVFIFHPNISTWLSPSAFS